MAKLKVGDIVIDDDGNVSFDGGGARPAPGPAVQHRPAPPPRPPRKGVGKVVQGLPGSAGLLAVLGSLALVAGLAGLGAGVAMLSGVVAAWLPVLWLVLGIPLSGVGFSLLALALTKKLTAPPGPARGAKTVGKTDLFEARMEMLQPLLELRDPEMTVERLIRETGMLERVVVETLSLAEQRGLVDEAVNLDTGEWYYQSLGKGGAKPAFEEPRSLEDRRQVLRQKQKEKLR